MRTFDYSTLEQRPWGMDILNLVAKIHECKGRQDLFVRQKRVELERLTETARMQSTESSNKIEGIVTSSARIKQLFHEKVSPRNQNENEIIGYRDVLTTVCESYDHVTIKPTCILQMHRDLLAKAALPEAGQFKKVQNYVNEKLADGTLITRFVPANPNFTPDAITNICSAYEQAASLENIDALILIPAFVFDFLCNHPFSDGNGRISRLLTLLLLCKSGYKVGKYVSIEHQMEVTKDRYYASLEQSDIGWHEGRNDPTPFIRYMLQVLLACYMEFEKRVNMEENTMSKCLAYDIVKKCVQGKIGKISAVEVVTDCPRLAKSSVLREIKKLVEEGMLTRIGGGRSTYYIRSDSK